MKPLVKGEKSCDEDEELAVPEGDQEEVQQEEVSCDGTVACAGGCADD